MFCVVVEPESLTCECTSVIRPVSKQGFQIRDSVFRLSQLYWTWFSALVPVLGFAFCVPCRSEMGTFLTGRSGHFSVPEKSQLPRGLAYQPTFPSCFVYSSTFLTICVNPSVCLKSEINNQTLPPSPSTLKQRERERERESAQHRNLQSVTLVFLSLFIATVSAV